MPKLRRQDASHARWLAGYARAVGGLVQGNWEATVADHVEHHVHVVAGTFASQPDRGVKRYKEHAGDHKYALKGDEQLLPGAEVRRAE